MSSGNIADIYNFKKWKINLTLLFGNEGRKLRNGLGIKMDFLSEYLPQGKAVMPNTILQNISSKSDVKKQQLKETLKYT